MTEWLMGEPTDNGVSHDALNATRSAPRICLNDATLDHRPMRAKVLTNGLETELIEAAERGEVRANEGSVEHVEVFRVDSVRTSIIGRPRPLSRHRRAHPAHAASTQRTLSFTKSRFVFQAFNLVPTLTAEQNITLPVALAGGTVDTAWLQQISSSLGLDDRLSHRPHELSGGQQQRVAVARALLTRPDVIFGDEPTGNLDSATGAEVLSLLRRSCSEMGQSIIMVTHDPVAASYADRVVLMKDGALVGELEQSTPETILGALGALGA